jgi:hypothetical protein
VYLLNPARLFAARFVDDTDKEIQVRNSRSEECLSGVQGVCLVFDSFALVIGTPECFLFVSMSCQCES